MKLQKIREMVEAETGLDISVKCRERDYVCARNIFYKLARNHTNATTLAISKMLGRNHATVLHGLKAFENYKFDKHYYDRELTIYDKLNEELTEHIEKVERLSLLIEDDFKLAEKFEELKTRYNYILGRLKVYEGDAPIFESYVKFAEENEI